MINFDFSGWGKCPPCERPWYDIPLIPMIDTPVTYIDTNFCNYNMRIW